MAKRFKGDVQVENDAQIDNNLNLPSQTGSRALELDSSGNVSSSTVTSAELARLSGVTSDIQTQIDSKQSTSEKGVADGYASLDSGGKVPSAQLPSYVDDVEEYADLASFPVTGETGKIYVALDTNKTYRWSGSVYVEISPSDVNSVFGRTGVVTAQTSDYDAIQIDYDNSSSGLTATNTQAAIDEIESRVDNLEVITTEGDLVIGDVSGNPSRLAIGLNNQVLTSDGTTASWEDLPADSDESVKVSVNDTTAGYLEDKVVITNGTNSTNPLESSTLNDGGDEDLQIRFDESKVNHDNLSGFVSNEHIDHSTVEITTIVNSGLTGGGDITSSRDLSVDINGTTEESSIEDSDLVLVYDSSASALKKVTRSNFVGSPNSSPGDIFETSFTGANNQAVAADVTGFAFANGTVRSFSAHVSILVDATVDLYETYDIQGIQKGASWEITPASTGDNSNVTFSITTAGQMQYTSDLYAGFVSLTIKFRAITTSV